MKIPLYQRQTALTRDSGARPLSAMASPGAYAQPANAAFQMGQAISGVGEMVGNIAIMEEKQENATLQIQRHNTFDTNRCPDQPGRAIKRCNKSAHPCRAGAAHG